MKLYTFAYRVTYTFLYGVSKIIGMFLTFMEFLMRWVVIILNPWITIPLFLGAYLLGIISSDEMWSMIGFMFTVIIVGGACILLICFLHRFLF